MDASDHWPVGEATLTAVRKVPEGRGRRGHSGCIEEPTEDERLRERMASLRRWQSSNRLAVEDGYRCLCVSVHGTTAAGRQLSSASQRPHCQFNARAQYPKTLHDESLAAQSTSNQRPVLAALHPFRPPCSTPTIK
jgi:hypothetical protein